MPQKKPQKIKRWFMFCEPCSHKQIIEKFENEELVEIKRSHVPGGSPRLNKEKKKIEERPKQSQPRMFKCPKCGRGCACKKLPDVYSKEFDRLDEKARKDKEDAEKKKRLEDGTPVVRKEFEGEEPEFTG